MSTPYHYKSNLRDITFNLFEVLRVQDKSLGQGPFSEMDEDTARDVLTALEDLSVNELAASFVDSDRVPLQFDGEGNVTLPETLTQSIRTHYEQEWDKLELPVRLGGFGAPPSVRWAAFELQAGASPCMAFYLLGTFMAQIIDQLGTASQKARYVRNMLDNHWGATMVLTEPDAGSDVGAGRAKARHIEGDVWELEGTKRFITNGDYDYPENIVHLTLARPEGAAAGTKGLSLFIVPKVWVEEDGSLGERNGIYVSAIEHKMGIKGSATCELTLGDKQPCRGLLVGEVHDGIRQMFNVIEYARMAVGMKSMATLSTAYLNALEYAKERVQGPDLAKAAQRDAPRVRIIEHPDVRRMLMEQKAHAEGMRALGLYAAFTQDQIALAREAGSDKLKGLERLNDLLLPLVKGYSSDRAFELLSVSLQVFGGSGYTTDYPIEQYVRDQKIDSLYEGTTHIQSLDLFFRKVARDGGKTLMGLMGQMQGLLKSEVGGDALAPDRAALMRALGDVGAIFQIIQKKLQGSLYHVGIHANRVLMSLAELVIGWKLLEHAGVAIEALKDAPGDRRFFYEGKIASCHYWTEHVLPRLTLNKKIIENGTLQLMEIPEEAF